MSRVTRPAPFCLLSTNHGAMIVNRNDYHSKDGINAYGVGCQLMTRSGFDEQEVDTILALLGNRRRHFGDGVFAIDCGANIGVHSVEWGRFMHGWGKVLAFEAQEKIYYALAGNVILNNCLNVTARHAAVGKICGAIKVPELDFLIPTSYGSLELIKNEDNTPIGQPVDYDKSGFHVPLISIDSLALERVDLIKIDVEGMEVDVLEGAAATIQKFKPQLMIEVIKSDRDHIIAMLEKAGYAIFPMGINLLALHHSDPQKAELQSKMHAA